MPIAQLATTPVSLLDTELQPGCLPQADPIARTGSPFVIAISKLMTTNFDIMDDMVHNGALKSDSSTLLSSH